MAEAHDGSSKAARRGAARRLEVVFCIPVYCLGLAAEIGIFAFLLSRGSAMSSWSGLYQEYHFPVLCSSALLIICPILSTVQLSGLDEDSLMNDPDYSSPEPSKRSAAVQRGLEQAQASWTCSVWTNAFLSAILGAAYGLAALGAPRDKVHWLYHVYCLTMSVCTFLAALFNYQAIQRVREIGSRGFPGGADALALEAKTLLAGDNAPSSSAGEQAGADGGKVRQRRRSLGTAEKGPQAQASNEVLALALKSTDMYLAGQLDKQGYADALKKVEVKMKAGGDLEGLVAEHEQGGGGNRSAFLKALQSELSPKSKVPRPRDGSED